MNVRAVKTILWFLFGAGLTVILLRIIHGPGSVVALTDLMPWGLWKGGVSPDCFPGGSENCDRRENR